VIQGLKPEARIVRHELGDYEWTAKQSPRPQGERPYGLLRGAYHPAALHAGCVARNDELAFSTATN
jgi:hypothetical protein